VPEWPRIRAVAGYGLGGQATDAVLLFSVARDSTSGGCIDILPIRSEQQYISGRIQPVLTAPLVVGTLHLPGHGLVTK
jgi:hypothetical protein